VLQIQFLADVPEHINQLADWHHAEWQHLFKDWTLDVVRAELREHGECKTLPTTLVLLSNNQLLGSVSLIEQDAPEFVNIGSPWLASLYVRPSERGKGFGFQLVQALIQHAKSIKVEKVFLFTPEHKNFYVKLGWKSIQQAMLHGEEVTVMNYTMNEAV
jgi:N-acetylglutamate synthase-like GNAT family acetyltransferase